ncbi:hypothetical protein ACJX0J_036682, partial [Zea mays]
HFFYKHGTADHDESSHVDYTHTQIIQNKMGIKNEHATPNDIHKMMEKHVDEPFHFRIPKLRHLKYTTLWHWLKGFNMIDSKYVTRYSLQHMHSDHKRKNMIH